MMKALILAGGRGQRMRGTNGSTPKGMLRVSGEPLITRSVRAAAAAGVAEIVVVVGAGGARIRAHAGDRHGAVRIVYVRQPAPRGVVDAMLTARDTLAGSDFLLFLADEVLVGVSERAVCRALGASRLLAVCGAIEVSDRAQLVKNYIAYAEAGSRRVRRLVEKPHAPAGPGPWWMGTGRCAMRNELLDYVDRTRANGFRGEQELPDLIQSAIDAGCQVGLHPLTVRGYANVNTPVDLAEAERIVAAGSVA